MNKVLVTGLALGKKFETCQACNFDFEWLIRYPSILLWADKILVPDTIWDTVSHGEYPFKSKELAKSLQLIFDIAKSRGIVEVVKPTEIISSALTDDILTEVYRDRDLLAKLFPDHVTLSDEDNLPGGIFIDGLEYCTPYLWTIYASFVLARSWNAHCLFNMRVLNYSKYKFGLANFPKEGEPGRIQAFQAVFEAYLPNSPIFPEYVYINKDMCSKCVKEKSCKDTYLSNIESNLENILSWRDYDEIQQLKSVVADIVRRRNQLGGIVNPSDILHDFRNKQDKIRRRMKSIFPKVKRWANVTTMLSIAIAVVGVSTEHPLIAISGAGLAGLSHLTKELINLLLSKYSWMGFVSKDAELHREK